ncbi:MAG: ABC transporter permease [Nocardioides sp.]|nr:ABC transporter permease [Nocardioides sp.]
MTATATAPATVRTRRAGWPAALAFELRKLGAQWRTRVVLLAALLAPIPLAVIIHAQGNPPKDTLFGRYATINGFSLALLVLGFASQWVLPLLTAVVAGDIFASEDHHGTWKTILTRSAGRSSVFAAKTIAALGFAVIVLLVLSASTIASATYVGGHGALTGLTGQLIPAHEAYRLVSYAWLSTIPPTIAFTGLAILMSVWTRNVAAGVATPVVLGMAMQLVGSMGGVEPLRPYLPTTAYEAWHGFLASPMYTGPFVTGLIASVVWTALTLGISWTILRRRDITGG